MVELIECRNCMKVAYKVFVCKKNMTELKQDEDIILKHEIPKSAFYQVNGTISQKVSGTARPLCSVFHHHPFTLNQVF